MIVTGPVGPGLYRRFERLVEPIANRTGDLDDARAVAANHDAVADQRLQDLHAERAGEMRPPLGPILAGAREIAPRAPRFVDANAAGEKHRLSDRSQAVFERLRALAGEHETADEQGVKQLHSSDAGEMVVACASLAK